MVLHPSARRSVTPEELAFATMYGLPAHLAAILGKLYRRETANHDRRHISELRQAMDDEAIDTTPEGYQLTEIGRADCIKALGKFRTWIDERETA